MPYNPTGALMTPAAGATMPQRPYPTPSPSTQQIPGGGGPQEDPFQQIVRAMSMLGITGPQESRAFFAALGLKDLIKTTKTQKAPRGITTPQHMQQLQGAAPPGGPPATPPAPGGGMPMLPGGLPV